MLAVFALLYGFFWGAAVFNGGRRIRMLVFLSLVLFAPGLGLHLWLRLTDPTDPLASQALTASVWLMGAGFATALLALVPSVIGKARS